MTNDRSTLLLADDDPTIADSLAPFLERAGFHVLVVSDGVSALEKAQAHHPELIILDVLMPRMDGREVLRRLRRSRIWTPTILLTQVGEASERALALEEGADDYLNKPFDPHELLARIRAVLRRARPGERSLSAAWLLRADGLSLDRRARRVTLDAETVDLTPKALAVLEYMMTHPDEAISRERLLEAVWGWEYPAGTRTVDTRMAELRRALDDDPSQPRFIETISGEGYRFIAKVEAEGLRPMFKKWWVNLLVFSLPLWVGLFCGILTQVSMKADLPVLVQADLGIAAFVIGGVVRQWSFFGFLLGFIITTFLIVLYFWDRRSIRQARAMIAEALRDMEQNRRSFLRRLDHEIKNPLTGLRASMVNLQEAQNKEERIRAADNAGRAVTRLSRLLADLRKLSDLGERPIERSRVDVPDLLQDAVDAAHVLPAYDGREVSLLIPKVPSPFPSVTGDRDLLVLAVYNLIENALKFTSGEDSVEVRASEDGQVIVIEVADSGGGIAPEDQPKIFEELYRGTNARSTEGSGLGLALVKRIIALHSGQIHVRSSQAEPRGTVFTIRLPVTRQG